MRYFDIIVRGGAMLNWLKNLFARQNPIEQQANEMAQIIIDKTNERLIHFQVEVNNQFKEVKSHIRQLDTNIEIIDKKLSKKEFADKQQYGQLHYKLNEVKRRDA